MYALDQRIFKSARRNRRLSKAGIESVIGRTNDPIVAEPLERRVLFSGGTFAVSNLNDSGAGSLRQAITSADAAGGTDLININVTGTILLASTLPALGDNITINGPGASLLMVYGNGHGSVITINAGVTAELENLTISGGQASVGGGIDNSGTLTIADSTVSGNTANDGAGIASSGTLTVTYCTLSGNAAVVGGGGGISSDGTLTVMRSTISGNLAAIDSGGIDGLGTLSVANSTISENSAGIDGGGITCIAGVLNISNSTISGNSAKYGGGISNDGTLALTNSTVSGNTAGEAVLGVNAPTGGGISNHGALAVTNSTISGNLAALGGYGGGLYNSGTLTLTNSTVSGNSTNGFGNGGGISNVAMLAIANCTISGNSTLEFGGGIQSFGMLTVTDSTIAGNSGHYGGGIELEENAACTLDGTLIAANNGGDIGRESSSSLSGSRDLIGDGSDGGVLTGSLRGTVANPLNPLLSALGNFGGPTQTIALMSGSPAIGAGANFPVLDAGNNDITATDQRGIPRPSGSGFDIGAFQSGPLLVNTLADPATQTAGMLSLREAISLANSLPLAQSITFAGGLSGVINLSSQLPNLRNITAVDGPGAGLLTINGGDHSNVFVVNAGQQVLIENLAITGGSATTNSDGDGGGILNNGGALTILDCTINGNTAGSGGAIDSSGPLTITNSTISGNVATGFGGGIYNLDTLNLTGSTISGNSAEFGGGIASEFNQFTVTSSTFNGNVASSDGGGIFSDGLVTMTNSTFSGNSAKSGGGAIFSQGQFALTDSTISGNTAAKSSGGGIYTNAGTGTMQLLDGAIVAGNTGGDISGFATFSGSNDLIGDGSNSASFTGSLSGTVAAPLNPLLSPLGDFGGPTDTMAPLKGSPMLGAGANFNNLTTDQRGFPRPTTSGIDIGADQGALFPGDANFDGTVNLTDLLTLLNNYGETGKGWTQGDFNFDGTVNLTDLLALLNNYGQSAHDNSIATPAASVVVYKAKSSPFASEPLAVNSTGRFTLGASAASSDDVDSEVLQTDSSVL